MKRIFTTILLTISVICLAYAIASHHREKALLNATEDVLDLVYSNDENYFLDVVTETDAYNNYIEIAESIK